MSPFCWKRCPELRSCTAAVGLSSLKSQTRASPFQAGYGKARRLKGGLRQIKERESQQRSGRVSCLRGKMPKTMKLNALEGAKMLLLHRGACGIGASKQTHRKSWVKAPCIRLVGEGGHQWDLTLAPPVLLLPLRKSGFVPRGKK